jgi:hypothetical protein
LWARMAAATPGASYDDRLQVYRERLRLFLEDAVHLVGTDGAPIHQGRSLTYRMAAAAPYWMGMLLDASPLSPGATRRLCSGMARHFVERGAPDDRGLLTLGWYDTFLPTTQAYSGPGSPYWASKGFVGLLLPPDHPVWTDREDTLPLDNADQVRAMPAPGWLVHATRHDQLVRLLNHGTDHAPPAEPEGVEPAGDPHYDRLAYSSHTGPELSAQAQLDRVDNNIALVDGAGRATYRGRVRRIAVRQRSASSWHNAWLGTEGPWRIETASVVYGAWEIRCALVEGPDGATVRSGGYPVAGASLPSATTGKDPVWGTVEAKGLYSTVVGLYGYDEAAVHRDLGASAFGPHSATPYLKTTHRGEPLVLVSAVLLNRDTVLPESIATGVCVEVDGQQVRLGFPDGTSEVVDLLGQPRHG